MVGSLLVGCGILLLPIGVVSWSYSRLGGGGALLLGGTLLALAWRLASRNPPLRLTLSSDTLRLAPLGRGIVPSSTAETIPLASIVAYKHWLSRGRAYNRYYLRLELAGGRVLRLADPPGGPAGDSRDTVPLPELVAQLARWVGPGTVVQPLFSQTTTARRLMQLGWLLLLGALTLLGQGHSAAGVSLLILAGSYLLSYFQALRQANRP